MEIMPLIALLIVGILAVNVLGMVLVVRWIKSKAMQRVEVIKQRFGQQLLLVAPSASLIGLESKTRGMSRGNGTLALTEADLVFQLWMPDTEIIVPRHCITAVSEVKAFGGKSIFKPLLRIDWTDTDGQQAAMAIYMPDLGKLKAQLEANA
ncbi:MAG: hypothetical protein CVV27_05015 [Candidatus Melainabacteria bacterium HGW-Melainabacteria-1]|nr:MAG: hypothetical protein CVV27_05015 [Candidatus Melainabacteria bacterium HGW-Melainabacteria-1]